MFGTSNQTRQNVRIGYVLETEFLYQSVRIPAQEGTLALWPAGYTHTHRGNPPLSGEKYLLTGWVEY
jgi:hypothetical protein